MFSSLLCSKNKLSWLPVVLLRQRFLLCLIEQHHTGGNEGGRIVFPRAIAGTELLEPTLAPVCHCCGKQAYCFLAALSAISFTLLSFLSSVLGLTALSSTSLPLFSLTVPLHT